MEVERSKIFLTQQNALESDQSEQIKRRSNRNRTQTNLNDEDEPMIIEVDKRKLTSNIRLPKRKRSMSDDEHEIKPKSKSRKRSVSSSSQERQTTKRGAQAKKQKYETIVEEVDSAVEYSSYEENPQYQARPTTKGKAVYNNDYDRVCAALQLSAIPDVLPCRDKERN